MTNFNKTFNDLTESAIKKLEDLLPEEFKSDAKEILFMHLCVDVENLLYFMDSDLVLKTWTKDFDESRQPDGATY